MAATYLDIMDPDFRPDAAEVQAAREADWYARTPLGYAVLRYEAADGLVGDRRLRQSLLDFFPSQGITDGPLYDFMRQFIATVEGPDHTRLRRLVSQAFTRRAVEAMRPDMRRIAENLIAGFHESGRCDFMADFADPYSAQIICVLLGVPEEQHDAFRGWANDLGLVVTPFIRDYRERIEAALAGLGGAVDGLIAKRRVDPRDDLLTALIQAEEAGDRLAPEELRAMVIGLLLAGQDATQHQLGRAMSTFLANQEQWDLLAERPDLAPTAVEEVMRVGPTSTAITRIAAEDFVFRDLTIEAGQFVTILLDPVHTDPEVFAEAGFDITQHRAAQLTFGGGPHFCLGAVLARAEMAEALPILARRMRAPEAGGPAPWRPAIGITGPTTLPLRFTPG
ncbi:cytochrome P450 [Streptomonospora wellingtoniae]|uniref:Cytochrome P450 n=1 Tax=Streptomonospora wellingtoniae TaxID=3075544 RepID=A0ABU2L106_9ACTN|nr:cytochrome P450 [Streptomonospora sp. DSM 45055]MDT0305241.1 cytochrome P450 [Streptomonospora sp. DSM 45055]